MTLLPPDHAFPEPQPQRARARLDDPALTHLVAEESNQLLGFTVCGASRDDDRDADTGEIHTFFVSHESWRRGVGRALMSAALGELRSRGYRWCEVWSFAANDGANAFYEACGFAREGAERTQEAWAHIPQVRYQRRLA